MTSYKSTPKRRGNPGGLPHPKSEVGRIIETQSLWSEKIRRVLGSWQTANDHPIYWIDWSSFQWRYASASTWMCIWLNPGAICPWIGRNSHNPRSCIIMFPRIFAIQNIPSLDHLWYCWFFHSLQKRSQQDSVGFILHINGKHGSCFKDSPSWSHSQTSPFQTPPTKKVLSIHIP